MIAIAIRKAKPMPTISFFVSPPKIVQTNTIAVIATCVRLDQISSDYMTNGLGHFDLDQSAERDRGI
jgi:hypothetical protein